MKTRRVKNNTLEICNNEGYVILSIEEDFTDGIMKINLTGEIKNEVAHDFEDEVMAVLSMCHKLELDFSGVTYIASMALRSLLSIQRMIDEMETSSMILTCVSAPVMEIFKESGFSQILSIKNK